MIWEEDGAAFIRDVGEWDPLPPHLAVPFRLAGRDRAGGVLGRRGAGGLDAPPGGARGGRTSTRREGTDAGERARPVPPPLPARR